MPLIWLLASALAVVGTPDASARHKHVSPHRKKTVQVEQHKHRIDKSDVASTTSLTPDLAAAKQAIELVRRHKSNEATTLAASSGDPVVTKLVEWALLRQFESEAGFDRYVSFIRANPDWPSIPLLRRRAEMRLWQEHRDSATVRRFVGEAPTSPVGRLALARIEIGRGEPHPRRKRGSRGVAVGAVVGRTGSRSARRVPRRADPRRPSRAHGSTYRGQGF